MPLAEDSVDTPRLFLIVNRCIVPCVVEEQRVSYPLRLSLDKDRRINTICKPFVLGIHVLI